MQFQKPIEWSSDKNELLKRRRGVSFEDVEEAIKNNRILKNAPHPNQKRYPHQRVFVVVVRSYAYNVPYVEDERKIFLKTIIPDSEATKKHLSKSKR